MGGKGSGNYFRYCGKETTGDYRRLDVRRWQREGLLNHGSLFQWGWLREGKTVALINVRAEFDHVVLSYRHRRGEEEWKPEEYTVMLDWAPCTFGGKRAWFLCPAAGCGRRVAILYGGDIFACRHCYHLAYESQREYEYDRLARRADKIREKLGWEAGILNGNGTRPKGMHRRTYERLKEVHDQFVSRSLVGIAKRIGIPHPHGDDD